MELLFPDDAIDPRYARLLFALAVSDVTQNVAPFTWVTLDTMRLLERYYVKGDYVKGDGGFSPCNTSVPFHPVTPEALAEGAPT